VQKAVPLSLTLACRDIPVNKKTHILQEMEMGFIFRCTDFRKDQSRLSMHEHRISTTHVVGGGAEISRIGTRHLKIWDEKGSKSSLWRLP
jgi:hypothetical protein